jgi:uncharacterized membrane protein
VKQNIIRFWANLTGLAKQGNIPYTGHWRSIMDWFFSSMPDFLRYIVVTAIILLPIIIFVILILAINQLHRLPQMQESVENIEKMLKMLVDIEKKRSVSENKDNPVNT